MLRRLFPSAPTAVARPMAHRAIAKRDVEHMRFAGDGSWVMPKANPGIRVEPAFVTDAEAAAIAAEVEAAADAHGYPCTRPAIELGILAARWR